MGRGNITLFHFRGIRIAVDYSWFVVLFLIIVWMSGFYQDVLGPEGSGTTAYLLAAASALGFFGSILLHELGHAIVALRNGIGITQVTLWMFGGMAELRRGTDTPGTEFRIAAAGPAVTLLIVIVLTALGIAISGDSSGFAESLTRIGTVDDDGLITLISWLASVNAIVLIFNMIPAFPLDGGRILLAIAWKITGSRTRATLLSANIGQGFSWLCMIGGGLMLFRGDIVGGIWLVLIGFILGSAARGARQQSRLTGGIEGKTVGDIMDPDPIAVRLDDNVQDALDNYFLRYQWPWFPVIRPDGRFVGMIERNAAENIAPVNRLTTPVRAVYNPDPDGSLQVNTGTRLDSLLGNDTLIRLGALAATDDDGRLVGIITVQQLSREIRSYMPG